MACDLLIDMRMKPNYTSASVPMHDLQANTSRTVLVSGAGVGGMALAFWLRRHGFAPTVIEQAPAFRDGGYMIDVWGVGYDLVERMGLLSAERERAYCIGRVWFVDEAGRRVAGFDGGVFRGAYGNRFFSIPRGDLAHSMHLAIERQVQILYSRSIRAVWQNDLGVEVELSTGESRRFDLLVGADGMHSRVRECILGDERQFEKYLGYYAASFVAKGYPHRDEGTYLSFSRPGRQITRYAMRDGLTAFLLVFAANKRLLHGRHDLEAQKKVLREWFGNDGWECPEILKYLDVASEIYFDEVSQMHVPEWSRGRIALVGDAAYCPSLLAGAGSAFAMLGAYVLAGELKMSNGDHRVAFAAYEKQLRPFMEARQTSAANFANYFAPKTAGGIFLRDLALNLMRIPFIGGWLINRAFANRFSLPDHQ
jgi:2-polyprenyl-6-methoxyphenol hydroxylase-like FAD-dependent oxidoreductase